MHHRSFSAPKQVRAVFPLHGLHLLTPPVHRSHAGCVFSRTECVCVCVRVCVFCVTICTIQQRERMPDRNYQQVLHQARLHKENTWRLVTSWPLLVSRDTAGQTWHELLWRRSTTRWREVTATNSTTCHEAVRISAATWAKMNHLTVTLFCFLSMRRTIISQIHVPLKIMLMSGVSQYSLILTSLFI